jgi:hypothetical protein
MTKENWTKGKIGGCIVTDTPDGLPKNSGHSGKGAYEYYGGNLVCESIWRKKDVALISAAPDLLEACLATKEMYEAQGIDENSLMFGEQYKQLVQAIDKATDICSTEIRTQGIRKNRP